MEEYGNGLNEIRDTFAPQAEAAWIEFLALPAPTLEDLETLANREVAIRSQLENEVRELEPPEALADLHDVLADWITSLRRVGTALADRAGAGGSWDELLQSAEYQAYESTLIGGATVCNEFQAELDATEARGAFADAPWIPGEMKEVADAVIGCGDIPEDLDPVLGRQQ
jgi:hypothetical protein